MDDFDDDSFLADDSFFNELDTIAAKAVKRAVSAGPAVGTSVVDRKNTAARGDVAKHAAAIVRPASKPAFKLAAPASRTTSAPALTSASNTVQRSIGSAQLQQRNAEAGPSRLPYRAAVRPGAPIAPVERSTSAGSVPVHVQQGSSLSPVSRSRKEAAERRRKAIADAAARETESKAAGGTEGPVSTSSPAVPPSARPRQSTLSFGPGPSAPLPPPRSASGPSGTGGVQSSRLGRTSSGPLHSSGIAGGNRGGGGSSGVQIHLNFRRENQTTKGKRWDRTEYAQTGRRIRAKVPAAKGKGKGKDKGKGMRASYGDELGSDVDLDLEGFDSAGEEDDEPLVPGPKPLIDTSKPYPPPKHAPELSAIGKYLYPTNRPKRDYQFEIVQACFTDNCLVALPTGLGKTFVAGVVMLNFYRWFPTGKIVFLAPTKPLVNQQIEACQLTCGIPSMDAAVMTGASVSAKERAKLWQERRVFYCTPQTLDNDLKARRLDPRDIVLAVFDEAHKASGSYAYTTILAFLMAHQPYFRVLALTATPGADVPKVQGVVDALHISRIEIREAEDPNISKYMNEKHTKKHVVRMSDTIEGFRDRWAALMKPYIVKLVEKDILTDRDLDAKRLKPFRITHRRMQITQDRDSRLKWAFGPLNSLEKMARAMTHLLEFSLGMFHTTLVEIGGNLTASGKKATSKGNSNALRNNFEFQRILRDVETEMNLIRIGAQGRTKGDGHPKMTQTMELLLEHFTKADEDEKEHGVKNDTRAMVFCSFRDCVLDIVDMLNVHSPVLRATKFVGQSQGKQDRDKGFNQKEQKKTINDFKDGKYNILVSTSIGEEGLDIGEVDFVVIYDMPKQSIKLLQRIGRTGRKRAGQVHVLMSEGREDLNWDKAQDSHREIQEEILHSRNLELFEDVERLLPVGKAPEVEEVEMEIDPWDPENLNEKLAASKAYQKAQKQADKEKTKPTSLAGRMREEKEKGPKQTRGAEIPDDAPVGFKSVAQLLKEQQERKAAGKGRGKGKRKRSVSPIRSESPSGDEMDRDERQSDEDGQGGDEDIWADLDDRAPTKRARMATTTAKPAKSLYSNPARKAARGRATPLGGDDGVGELDNEPEIIDLRGEEPVTASRLPRNADTTRDGTARIPQQRSLSPDFDFGFSVSDIPDIDTSHLDDLEPASPSPVKQAAPLRPLVAEVNSRTGVTSASKAKSKAGPRPVTQERLLQATPTATSSGQVLDFLNHSGPVRRGGARGRQPTPPSSSASPSPDPSPTKGKHLPPSPITDESLERAAASAACRQDQSIGTNGRLSPRTAQLVGFSQIAPADMSWDLDEEDSVAVTDLQELEGEPFPQISDRKGNTGRADQKVRGADKTAMAKAHVESTPSAPSRRIGLARPRPPSNVQATAPVDPFNDILAPGASGIVGFGAGTMLPPPIPVRSGVYSSPVFPSPGGGGANELLATPTFEATQFPVRRGGAIRRKVMMSSSEHGTPVEQAAIAGLRRGQIDSTPLAPVRAARPGMGRKRRVATPSGTSSPSGPPAPRISRGPKRQRAKRADVEQLMEINAELSGSATSDESGSDLDRETHSDKIFAGEEFAPTQAPKGYDQRAMYRAGLSTQAGSKAGLGFQPNKRKEAFLAKARKPVYVTDEERSSGSENDYELGSFVVDDEDDLL